MSRTSINVSAAGSANNTIVKAKRSVTSAKEDFRSTSNNVDSKIKNRNNINNRLNSIHNQLSDIEGKLSRISQTVQNGLQMYSSTDSSLEQKTKDIQRNAIVAKSIYRSGLEAMFNSTTNNGSIKKVAEKSVVETSNAKKTEDDSNFGKVGKNIFDTVVNNAGLGGGFVSSVIGMYETFSDEKLNIGAVAKSTKSFVSSIYKNLRNADKLEKLSRMNPGQAVKTGIKRFIGFDKAFIGELRPSVAKSFSTRFYNNYQKQIANSLDAYKGKGLKSALSWAGVAVSGISNTIQNIEEAKSGEISATRAVAETVLQTGVDVAADIFIGAAVSAGIAALGFTSAPVLVVGAATAGVVAGVNAISKLVFKKDLSEAVTDLVLDAGEAVVKTGKKIVSESVKAISNAGKAVGSFFKKLF